MSRNERWAGVFVRLTSDEQERVKLAASILGVSMVELLRRALLNYLPADTNIDELRAKITEIRSVYERATKS